MIKLKKIVAPLLVCAICFTSSLGFAASNDLSKKYGQEFKITAKALKADDSNRSLADKNLSSNHNKKGFSQKFQNGNCGDVNPNNSRIDLDLSGLKDIVINDITPFETQGTITVLKGIHPIKAKGDLVAVNNGNGDIVYSGVLKGFINNNADDDNQVLMGINYYPKKEKVAINVTIGVVDEKKNKFATILSFGEAFPEISKASEKFKDVLKNKKQNADSINVISNNIETTSNNITSVKAGGSLTSDDLSPRLKATDVTCGNSLYVGLFHQNKAYVQTNNEVAGKAVVQYNNMLNYIKKNYGSNITSFSCWEAWIKLISADAEYESTTGVTPQNGSKSVSLTLPLYFGSTFGWQFTSMSFDLSSTTVSYSACTGAPSGRNNIVLWDLYRNFGGFKRSEFSTTASDPIASNSGFAAKSIYYYRSGVSYSKNVSIGAKSTVKLSWDSPLGTYYLPVSGLAASNININPL